MDCFKKLGVERDASLKEIKEGYYKRLKEIPLEEDIEKFINLNVAFNEAQKKNREKQDLYKILVSMEEKRKMKQREIIKKIVEGINSENFNIENEKIIESIKKLKSQGRIEESLLLAFLCEIKFRKFKLENLGDAYRELEKFIVKDI